VKRFFIIDTNVVVAGLLTSHTDSPVARILDGMLNAAFPFVLSEPLLAEYRSVLLRPHLRQLHRLTETEVDTLLLEIARHGIVLDAKPATQRAPDPGDQFVWDLLATRDDLQLVTGDKLLLQDLAMQPRTLTPSTCVALLWQ